MFFCETQTVIYKWADILEIPLKTTTGTITAASTAIEESVAYSQTLDMQTAV